METMMSDQEIADKIKTKVLDEVPFSFGVTFEKSWLNTVTVEQYIDRIARELAIKINFSIPGIERKHSAWIPRTWWDHFKIEMFPQWLLELFPSDYEIIPQTIIHELYPLEQFRTQKPEARA